MHKPEIGEYIPATTNHPEQYIRRWSGNNEIYKDRDAFRFHPSKVCYIPDSSVSDKRYTQSDFLKFCDGNKELAYDLLVFVDGEMPEETVKKNVACGYWARCKQCGKLYNTVSKSKTCWSCGYIN